MLCRYAANPTPISFSLSLPLILFFPLWPRTPSSPFIPYTRIFLLDPTVPFKFATCENKTWDCYFEPLSNCTIQDAEMIAAKHGYGQMMMKKEDQVLRPVKVSCVCKNFSWMNGYLSGWVNGWNGWIEGAME